MANAFIKAEKVVRTALGVLEREIVLPRLVWRDAGGDFAGAKDDTITIRLPAYTNARTRALRATAAITVDELDEAKVDVTLDTNVYKAVGITDEELTLDIENFGAQVIAPVVASVARGIEDAVATEISGATYELEVTLNEADPYLGVVDARKALNDSNVPMGGRALLVGSAVEAALLKSDRFVKVDESGTSSALREAQVGRISGFDVFTANAVDEDEAFAFHQSAFVLSLRAPVVPDGVPWGSSQSFAGLAMRAIRDYDPTLLRDRFIANTFVGTGVVEDHGSVVDGKFVPADTPDTANDTDLVFVRGVKLSLPGS